MKFNNPLIFLYKNFKGLINDFLKLITITYATLNNTLNKNFKLCNYSKYLKLVFIILLALYRLMFYNYLIQTYIILKYTL